MIFSFGSDHHQSGLGSSEFILAESFERTRDRMNLRVKMNVSGLLGEFILERVALRLIPSHCDQFVLHPDPCSQLG